MRIMILCGKQGIAFHGHRDDQIIFTDEEESEAEKEGNFIELVCFRAETDVVLRNHLQHAPKKAQYTSKTVQNELIGIIGKRICSNILSEVN